MDKKAVIVIDDYNQEFYSEVMNQDLKLGEVIVRLEGACGVTYSKVPADKVEGLTTEKLAEMDLKYHRVFDS